MKFFKNPYCLVLLFLCCFNYSTAQKKDFTIDSLQIKVYTEIEYVNGQSKEIKVKKVFCDYCSNSQIEALNERALQLAFYDRYNPNERMVNGIRKFAIIIRISKEDLLAMKTDKDSLKNK